MTQAFRNRLTALSDEKPVLLLDARQIALDKQASGNAEPLTSNDLWAATQDALQKHHESPPEENPNLIKASAYTPTQENIEFYGIGDEIKTALKNLSQDGDFAVAIVYSESKQLGESYTDLDGLINYLNEDIVPDQSQNLLVLMSQEGKAIAYSSVASPWMDKVSKAQLRKLNTGQIVQLANQFIAVLTRSSPGFCTLVSDYGSGKTTMLNALKIEVEKQGLPGITFMSGLKPFAEQKKALAGDILFVDEAANLTPDQLQPILNRNDQKTILLYPNEEAKQEEVKKLGT